MKRKLTLLFLSAFLTTATCFGQWISHDSTLTNEGNYIGLGWPPEVTITIPEGVTVNTSTIGGNGSLILNGTLNATGGVQVMQTFIIGQNAELRSGGLLNSNGSVVIGENAIIAVQGFSPSLSNGQTIELKDGVKFTVETASTINAGSLLIDAGATFNANSDLNLSNSNNVINGTLNVGGTLMFNSNPNTIDCPGKIITYNLMNNSGTPPIEGSGYIEVQHNFNSSNKFTNSAAITLNVLGTTTGNIGDASIGTASQCAPTTLPVSILNFQGQLVGNTIHLTWITATESNNSQFVIERSIDGIHYSAIGTKPSQVPGGNSTQNIPYNFTDNNPASGVNIYRLKQVDKNGVVNYFGKTVSLTINRPVTIQIYPNPVQTTLHISGADHKKAIFIIADANGRQVLKSSKTVINVAGLASGIYFIQMINDNQVSPLGKFIKN